MRGWCCENRKPASSFSSFSPDNRNFDNSTFPPSSPDDHDDDKYNPATPKKKNQNRNKVKALLTIALYELPS